MLSVADRFCTMRWPGALPGAETNYRILTPPSLCLHVRCIHGVMLALFCPGPPLVNQSIVFLFFCFFRGSAKH